GPLGGGPQPIERPVGQPGSHRLLKKAIAQAQHARLAAPLLDEGALVRRIQRKGAEDGEAAGKVAHGLEGHLGRLGIPARRMDHGGVDTALVHQTEGLLGGERGDLAMGHVAGQPAAPEMDLSIHEAHQLSPLYLLARRDSINSRWRLPRSLTGLGGSAIVEPGRGARRVRPVSHTGGGFMVSRRTFLSLVAASMSAPRVAFAQPETRKVALYANVGPDLTTSRAPR